MIGQKEKDRLVDFIYSREKPEGGFSFAKTTPPTIEDTYYALSLLKELKISYNNKKTLQYIQSINLKRNLDQKQLYRLIYLYDILSLFNNKKSVENYLLSRSFDTLDTISEMYYITKTKELLDIDSRLSQRQKDILSSITIEKLKYISDCEKYLSLVNKYKIPFEKQDYIVWIQNAQNPDGCFGFFPKTTSFLENTFHALKALNELRSSPNSIKKCEQFIHSCRTLEGGFGRQTTSVPTLEYSYYAIISLKIIDKMKKCK